MLTVFGSAGSWPPKVPQKCPPASPSIRSSLSHRQLWAPVWEVPSLENEVQSSVPTGLSALTGLGSRVQVLGRMRPSYQGPRAKRSTKPPSGPLAGNCPQSPLPAVPTAPSPGSTSAGSTAGPQAPPQGLQSSSKSPVPACHGGGPWSPSCQP